MSVEIKVQPLQERNIIDVLRIQEVAYADNFLESADSFISKIVASPNTSCAAWLNNVMVGYLIAIPLASHVGLTLNSSEVPGSVALSQATVMYIHDLAVHPEVRGHRVAHHLLTWLTSAVEGSAISEWKLVSVQGSREFWEKQGFEVSPDLPPNGYGPEAVLMLRR